MLWRSPSLRRDRRRSWTPAQAHLGLEPLEDRLQLATVAGVSVELDDDFNLVITGDDKANKVIIEQRGTSGQLAYVWVNGKKTNGGKAFDVQGGSIIVDLAGGNDSLTIRGQKGKSFTNFTTDYQIDLGAGNDTFVFAPVAMNFSDVAFSKLDLGAGNDKATFTPGAMNSSSLIFGEVLGGLGNDVFTLTFTTTRNGTLIGVEPDGFIDLGEGDDTFAMTWKTFVDTDVAFSNGLYVVGVDLGLGNDKLQITKGAVTRGYLRFGFDLGEQFQTGSNETGVPDGVNAATISGSGIVSEGAEVLWAVYGGSNRDSVVFDDDRIFYNDSLVSLFLSMGAGDDVVTVNMDSNKSKFEGIGADAASNAAMNIDVNLGDGNDKFTQTFNPRYWRLQNGAKLAASVTGGKGDDQIRINKSAANTLNLDGTFDLEINADEGVDLVDVNLGSVLRIGESYFHVDITTDGGKDTVNLTTWFEAASRQDPTYDDDTTVITVRMGAGVDKLWLDINNKSPNMTVFVTARGGAQTGDTFASSFKGDVKASIKGFDGHPDTPDPPDDPDDPDEPDDPDDPDDPPVAVNPTTSSTTTTPTAAGAVATTTTVTTSPKETIITTTNTTFDKTTGATTTSTNTVVVPLDGDPAPDSSTSAATFASTTATGKVVTTVITTILANEIKTTTITTTTNNAAGTATTTTSTSSTPLT